MKVVIRAEVELDNAAMDFDTAVQMVADVLQLRAEVQVESTYQESLMDVNGNTVGNVHVEVTELGKRFSIYSHGHTSFIMSIDEKGNERKLVHSDAQIKQLESHGYKNVADYLGISN